MQRVRVGAGQSGATERTSASVFVQRKLTVGSPGDRFEREADQVADRVMRGDSATVVSSGGLATGNLLQRCATCDRDDEDVVRRSVTAGDHNGLMAAPPSVSRVLQSGGGVPLHGPLRQFMESRIGFDFSQVRVHTGGAAASSAADIQARAYTAGNQIVFGRDEYDPGTASGQRLLAHELAHVQQQRRGRMQVRREGIGDVRMAEGYHAMLATIRASEKFAALTAADLATFDALVTAIEAETSWPNRLQHARALETVFGRTATAAERDAAGKTLLALGVDVASVGALLATLAKPFAGYVASGFDFSKRFFKHSGTLGFTVENAALGSFDASPYDKGQPDTVTSPAEKSFQASDILFFSGHQYAQYKEPGVFTNDASDSCFNISMLSKENKRVKLVVSTSCATICKDVAGIWKAKFPDALILGYRFSAPTDGSKVADAFAKQLIALGPISLSDASSVDKVRSAWKKVVLGPGSIGGGPALLQNGVVEMYEGGKWVSRPWDSKANECHYH